MLTDSHVHFWDPGTLDYPWLGGVPAIRRPFLPGDYAAAVEGAAAGVTRIVFVEANPRAAQAEDEVSWVESLVGSEPRIAGIVALVDLVAEGAARAIERLAGRPLVRGIRHNIQGRPRGFCLQPAFVDGVREAGRHGLAFDLCATHDQLGEVAELARACPGTRLVLDHCGKPDIRSGALDPWRDGIDQLAVQPHVWCKLSGLLTEAAPGRHGDEVLRPYVDHVVARFGAGRLMYGSDWPVLTLAGGYGDWYQFTRRYTGGWSDSERHALFDGNAAAFYRLPPAPPSP